MADRAPDATDRGKRFGRYQVVERLGVGAMGAVYRARDESLGRDVAVKTVHAPGASGFQAQMFRQRFENEARAVASLTHECIVPVFDLGVEGDTPYLVMELLQGGSLADRLQTGSLLSPAEAETLARQMASALAAAHARSIVHRDVKPGNILAAAPGKWKLADFGVAHVPQSSLTITGQFLGSPAYSAPEALGRGDHSTATDIYGLGATLYAALAGEPPFGPDGLLSEGAFTRAAPYPIASRCPGLSEPLARAISASLERAPERRPTAAQLAQILAGVPADPAPGTGRAESRGRAGLYLLCGALALGILLGVAMSGDDQTPVRGPGPPSYLSGGSPPGHNAPMLDEKDRKKQERAWRKVEDKLRKGKHDEALEHLDEILRRDPGDAEARALYQQLAHREWHDGHDEDDEDDEDDKE